MGQERLPLRFLLLAILELMERKLKRVLIASEIVSVHVDFKFLVLFRRVHGQQYGAGVKCLYIDSRFTPESAEHTEWRQQTFLVFRLAKELLHLHCQVLRQGLVTTIENFNDCLARRLWWGWCGSFLSDQ